MLTAYFDCFSGISGDMIMGALIDTGLDAALLKAEIAKLDLGDVDLEFAPTRRLGIAATKAEVVVGGAGVSARDDHHHHAGDADGDGHSHRHVDEILDILRSSRLDDEVKDTAARIFERLAEAEARVHGTDRRDVHLHEVGSIDAIVDIVGAVAGLRLLRVEEVFSSPLRVGTGFAKCAHGRYPVPVPAVLALCSDVPLVQTDLPYELVTPTGAAIITSLATSFGAAPQSRLQSVGYGAGSRETDEVPNLLRLRLGETGDVLARDRVVSIDANIDDMNPEVFGYLFERLFETGARDVFITPVYMKKGRPGSHLSVLVDDDRLDAVVDVILSETTSMGVRFHQVERRVLKRSSSSVHTEYGEVGVVIASFDGATRMAPEYEDCARLAREKNVPILAVYEAAARARARE